jgi:hypothetical protein
MNRDQFQRAAIPYSPEYTNQMYDASQQGLPPGDPNHIPLHNIMTRAHQEQPMSDEAEAEEGMRQNAELFKIIGGTPPSYR